MDQGEVADDDGSSENDPEDLIDNLTSVIRPAPLRTCRVFEVSDPFSITKAAISKN